MRGALPLAAIGVLSWGIASLLEIQKPFPVSESATTAPALSDPFREAVNKATSAAVLAQTAHTQEEWEIVASLWQEAADLMATVPMSSDRYAVAQQRVIEYPTNRQYAEQHIAQLLNQDEDQRQAQVQAGKEIVGELRGITQLEGLLAGRPVVQLLLSEQQWNDLSKAKQVSLTFYAESLVETIRSSPEQYVGVPASAPIYDRFVSKASRLCSDCWQVVVGDRLSIGAFVNERTVVQGDEVWSDEDPCCRGAKASEFRS